MLYTACEVRVVVGRTKIERVQQEIPSVEPTKRQDKAKTES